MPKHFSQKSFQVSRSISKTQHAVQVLLGVWHCPRNPHERDNHPSPPLYRKTIICVKEHSLTHGIDLPAKPCCLLGKRRFSEEFVFHHPSKIPVVETKNLIPIPKILPSASNVWIVLNTARKDKRNEIQVAALPRLSSMILLAGWARPPIQA